MKINMHLGGNLLDGFLMNGSALALPGLIRKDPRDRSRSGRGIPKRAFMKRRTGQPRTSGMRTGSVLLAGLITAGLVLLGVYWQQDRPCREPVTYRIGTVDARFGISRSEVAEEVQRAAAVWEGASKRALFREDRNGAVRIDFIYDYRQEAADKLKGMMGRIESTRDSYDSLKAMYERLKAEHDEREAALKQDIDAYEERGRTLKTASAAAAARGGVSEDVYRQMTAEKQALDELREGLEINRESLEGSADNLNSLVTVINGIAEELNLDVVQYNAVGETLNEEFSEGFYERKGDRQTITVYHFSSRLRLKRVLAHELGHALGLGHNDNPKAIMYRLNQSDSLDLAPEDLSALKALCGGR